MLRNTLADRSMDKLLPVGSKIQDASGRCAIARGKNLHWACSMTWPLIFFLIINYIVIRRTSLCQLPFVAGTHGNSLQAGYVFKDLGIQIGSPIGQMYVINDTTIFH